MADGWMRLGLIAGKYYAVVYWEILFGTGLFRIWRILVLG